MADMKRMHAGHMTHKISDKAAMGMEGRPSTVKNDVPRINPESAGTIGRVRDNPGAMGGGGSKPKVPPVADRPKGRSGAEGKP